MQFANGNYWLHSLLAALAACLASLAGAFTLWMSVASLKILVPLLVSLAVGVLLGDAFLHLIPESVSKLGSITATGEFVILGILLFFAIEKVVRGHHRHEVVDPSTASASRAAARMNLVGDAIHNFTDGVLIAGSFAADMLPIRRKFPGRKRFNIIVLDIR